MKNILTLNAISPVVNDIFGDNYKVSDTAENPTGILLRSFKMHDYPLSPETIAVARAGAGVNNIPVDEYAARGVVVFNTPGANANAVKELVIAALLLGSRKIPEAINWVEGLNVKELNESGEELSKLVEKKKSNFAGREVYGKKLGVIGLGAIGANVANAALSLGMEVFGYDPFLSVRSALQLSRAVNVVKDIEEIYKNCDYITLHIPYIPAQNKDFINAEVIEKMKNGAVLINLARGELVNNADIIKATENGKIYRYVTDFPATELIGVKNIVCIPHLGASTEEAEENCAVMAAKQLLDYIENGNITNSVNYPNCSMPRSGAHRLVVLHKNVNNLLAQITAKVAEEGVNIANLTNQSRGNYAVTVIDADSEVSDKALKAISQITNVIRVRDIK